MIVAHSVYYLEDGRAGRLRVNPVVQQRYVRRPLDDTVHAIGRVSGQLILRPEPTGRLCASTDYRQWFVPQASQAARLGSA